MSFVGFSAVGAFVAFEATSSLAAAQDRYAWRLIAVQGSLSAALLFAATVSVYRCAPAATVRGWLRWSTPWVVAAIPIACLAAVVAAIAAGILQIPSVGLLDPPQLSSTAMISTLMVIAVVVGPIGEELVFRGIVLDVCRERLGSDRRALAVAAIAFALFHVNPARLLPTFVAGWVLGELRLRSGSLWPAMVGHASINVLGTLALVWGST